MDPARVNSSAPGAMLSDSVVVDPTSQIPDPTSQTVPLRAERPRKKRGTESTLVLRNRQLDHLRAEVRKQYTSFRYRRMASLVVWAALGGAAVLLGAFLARGFGDDEEVIPPAVAAESATGPGAAQPTAPAARSVVADSAGPTARAAAAEPATLRAASAEPSTLRAAEPSPVRPVTAKKKPAASQRPLSLDELPTR